MSRVKRGVTKHARHKKVLEQTKGFRGRHSKAYKPARNRLEKSLAYAYRDRRTKKRTYRALWIQRINAGVRAFGLTYSRFIGRAQEALASNWTARVLADIAFRRSPRPSPVW